MFCMSCGRPIPDEAPYCRYCGDETGVEPQGGRKAGNRCPECGAALKPGQKFCVSCGASIPFEVSAGCPQCGWPLADDACYCEGCGRALSGGALQVYNGGRSKPPRARSGSGKKILRLVLIVVLAAAVLTGLFFLGRAIFSGGSGDFAEGVFYMDGDALYLVRDLKTGDSVCLCEDIVDGGKLAELADDEYCTEIEMAMQLTSSYAFVDESGKYAYYHVVSMDGEESLYCAETAKLGRKNYEPEKVASNVWDVCVLDGGNYVFYISSNNSSLYLWHKGESTRIDRDVVSFSYQDGLENLLYRTSDGVSIYDLKSEEVIPAFTRGYCYLRKATADLSEIVLEYSDALYVLKRNGDEYESTRLKTDVSSVYAFSPSGTFYYNVINDDYDTTAVYYYDGSESTLIFSADPDEDEYIYIYTACDDPSAIAITREYDEYDLYLSVSGGEAEWFCADDFWDDATATVGDSHYLYFTNWDEDTLRVLSFTDDGVKDLEVISRYGPELLFDWNESSLYVGADGNLYYLENVYDYDVYSGDLYLYDLADGSSERVASDVVEDCACMDDAIAFYKNVDYDRETADLLLVTDGEGDTVAYDVLFMSCSPAGKGVTYLKDPGDRGAIFCYYENGTEYELFEVSGATSLSYLDY